MAGNWLDFDGYKTNLRTTVALGPNEKVTLLVVKDREGSQAT
jgi:hypothetical protein